MWIIYRQALQVLAWLGLGLEAFDQAFDIAIEYSGMISSADALHGRPEILIDVCRRDANTQTISDWYESLEEFRSLGYWSRAWVQQEFILARSVMLLSGSRAIGFDVLWNVYFTAFKRIRRKRRLTWFDLTAFTRAESTRMETQRAQVHWAAPWSVFDDASNLGCVDLRDRIYSQLSLVTGGDQFDVDYNEDSYGLFLRTMFFFRNHINIPKLFQRVYRLAQSLDLLLVCFSDELRLRACTKQPYRKLLALFTTTGEFFDWPTHQWPEQGTKHEASSDDCAMKCPDCGWVVSSSLRPDTFTQLCCLDTSGIHGHLSFAPSSSVCMDDPDSRMLIYHGVFLEGMCDQENPVRSASGVCLNLATCLLLLQHHFLDEDIALVHLEDRDEKELRIPERLATMRSDCCEEHRSLRSDVLVSESNDPLLARDFPAGRIL